MMQIEKGYVTNVLILPVTTKLLILLDYIALIHILLRSRDKVLSLW